MPKNQIHIRADDETDRKLRELAERWDTTITAVAQRAIDLLYWDTMRRTQAPRGEEEK